MKLKSLSNNMQFSFTFNFKSTKLGTRKLTATFIAKKNWLLV